MPWISTRAWAAKWFGDIVGLDQRGDGAITNAVFALSCHKPDQRHHGGDLLSGLRRGDPGGCDQFLGHFQFAKRRKQRFACENDSVRACLARLIPARQTRSAAYMAAFYVDGAPVARRLMWDQSEALEVFGIERDLFHAGVPAEGIQPLLEVMRANLEHLNELRAQVLVRAQMAQVSTMNVP